ncbi:MAG TPA: hypothetical protein VFU30_03115 [Gaiellaceae bacterium]|nr:hypothetical protein [Gaiellaceae bacterium]
MGALDCNGFSPIQLTVKSTGACTDIRGFVGTENANNRDGRFFDNGHYIGHDEPDLTFLSNRPGSGNDVTWTETLPMDPAAAPTVANPGSDVTHFFELSVAPWFSMALCNPQSYPLNPCTPNSDANAPSGRFTGGGSSFLEVQFYPPGEAPFFDNVSCDATHWCASLHINDAECTFGFASCNTNCEEPTNFAFIQKDGVPTGPPSPQESNLATSTPNGETLLMSPGDTLRVHIFDAPAEGGGHALEVQIDDLTSGETGFMQASAANGYMQTQFADCSGIPFNYEPEYSSAAKANVVPWGAIAADISTEFEIGHATPCTSLSDLSTNFGLDFITGGDPFFLTCHGPYEAADDGAADNPESLGVAGLGGDGFCYPAGDTHSTLYPPGTYLGGSVPPNPVDFCLDALAGGDLDFDGTSYWPDWPTGTSPTATNPGSFVQSAPLSQGHKYPQSFFQTDVALSESACEESADTSPCTVPPDGPGNFYPFWSTQRHGSDCSILFGNVTSGPGVNSYGQEAQYGTDLRNEIGYDEFESKVGPAVC